MTSPTTAPDGSQPGLAPLDTGAVRFALEDNLVIVPLQKHCCLVLSVPQYLAGIRRGKWWRRRVAMLKRTPEAAQTPPDSPPGGTLQEILGRKTGGPSPPYLSPGDRGKTPQKDAPHDS